MLAGTNFPPMTVSLGRPVLGDPVMRCIGKTINVINAYWTAAANNDVNTRAPLLSRGGI